MNIRCDSGFYNRCKSTRLTNINGTFDASPYYSRGIPLTNTIPVVLSHPHFLYGDPTLHASITGIEPNKEKHSFYVDVHAVSSVCKHFIYQFEDTDRFKIIGMLWGYEVQHMLGVWFSPGRSSPCFITLTCVAVRKITLLIDRCDAIQYVRRLFMYQEQSFSTRETMGINDTIRPARLYKGSFGYTTQIHSFS